MDQFPYRIVADRVRALVRISFDVAFWDVGLAERFRADALAAVAALGAPPGSHVVLVDLQNAVLQSQDVYERMQALAGSATAARIALVAAAPLARMQTKRLRVRDDIEMFADAADAEAWLLGADRRAA